MLQHPDIEGLTYTGSCSGVKVEGYRIVITHDGRGDEAMTFPATYSGWVAFESAKASLMRAIPDTGECWWHEVVCLGTGTQELCYS